MLDLGYDKEGNAVGIAACATLLLCPIFASPELCATYADLHLRDPAYT